MEIYLNQVASLLAREYLFMGLDEDQLKDIAGRFQPTRQRKGRQIFHQGRKADYFYLIYQGKIGISRTEKKRSQGLYGLGSGDYFGEHALLTGGTRATSAAVTEDAILLWLDRTGFMRLLADYPHMETILRATMRSRALARKKDFSWLKDRETIHLIHRKHMLFLILGLILPVGLAILSVLSLVTAIYQAGSSAVWMFLLGGIFGLFLAVIWGWWNWANWENDYFVVTNWRVLWIEKVIGFYESRQEARLDKAQSNNVTRPFFGRLLDYGTLQVNTYTGRISMQRVNKPSLVAAYVDGLKERAKAITIEDETSAIKGELKQAYDVHNNPQDQNVQLVKGPVKKTKKKKPGYFGDAFRNFLRLRYESDGVITYRKHWFILLRKNLLPLIILLVLAGLVAGMGIEGSLFNAGLGGNIFLASIFAILIIWVAYNYLDWSNDLYQLNAESIREIERKPLGEEMVNTAKLENILSIEHARENFIRIILNFGTVAINVGDRQFTFNDVKDPSRVHQDIANYQDNLSQRKREAELKRERSQHAQWFPLNEDVRKEVD